MMDLLPFILFSLLSIGIFLSPFLLMGYLWRRKYVHKKSGMHKCGTCGRVADPIYVSEGMFYTKYHCHDHAFPHSDKKPKYNK